MSDMMSELCAHADQQIIVHWAAEETVLCCFFSCNSGIERHFLEILAQSVANQNALETSDL